MPDLSKSDPPMPDLPRVSVLMPVYNGARFLESAVRSVLGQTFVDFELVAVDDGSTDETPRLLAELAAGDGRIRVFRQENTGIVGALNNGLARCRGEYIARMDGDDLCLPERFAEQVAHLDRHPGCVLVGGLAQSIDESGAPRGIVSGGPHRLTRLDIFPPRIAVSIHPLVMIRRAALEAIGGYRADFPHAEDYDLYIRLSTQGRIDNPDRVMLKYRTHGGSVSTRNLEAQELAAARSELSAMLNREINGDLLEGGNVSLSRDLVRVVSQRAFATYVRYRIWRRVHAADRARGRSLRREIVGATLSPRPADLLDAAYNRLRLRMAAGVARSIYRDLRGGRP